MRRIAALVCLTTVVLCSCGIFAPREPGDPLGTVESDPFELMTLLDGTGKEFQAVRFEELFADGFSYEYTDREARTAAEHIEYLNRLQETLPDLSVVWQADSSQEESASFFEGGTGTLYREYFIWKDGDRTRLNDAYGPCRFHLVLTEKNEWRITTWYDEGGFFYDEL